MEAELMNLALLSTTEDKIDAAKLVNNKIMIIHYHALMLFLDILRQNLIQKKMLFYYITE